MAYDVAIVGGGPIGLSSSILLSLRGISNVLFERHPDTSIHPKACGINQRTTEIFRQMGIEEEVYKHAAPPEIAGRTAWYTSLGSDGREITSRDAWGGGEYAEEYKGQSPSRYCILPQIRLEPILKRRAIELNPTGIHYNSEVTRLEQNDSCAILNVRRGISEEKVEARFVIISDGGRSFTDSLGVKWIGERDIFSMVTAHFKSPLRSLHPDPRNFITWFSNPELGGSTKTGYLYQIGPWPFQPGQDEEWVFACALNESDPERFDQETMIKRLRRTIQIPDLPVVMQSFSHWTVNAIHAERYRVGRAFLVGDSAHKIPPWGALGMNSGIQDAQNLIWKLQLALQNESKYDKLLDTYEIERLPIGKRVGLSSLHNLRNHAGVMDIALGLSEGQSIKQNQRNIAPAFDPTHPDYHNKRAAIQRAQEILDLEFKAPGTEIGWFYSSVDRDGEGGSTHDGQLLPGGTLNSHSYVPTTIPGHFVPHAWLRKGDVTLSVFDLVPLDRLLLLTGDPGWEEFEDERVHHEIIGNGGWTDTDGEWTRRRGVDEDGAILVRPDGIVAWRGGRDAVAREGLGQLVDRVLDCVVANGVNV